MKISIKTTKWYEDAYAALIIFTRIPFEKCYRPSPESYSRALAYWPLTGWLTAAVSAGVLYAADTIVPYQIAVIAAIATRMLLTGAIYEEGMRDFISERTGRPVYGKAAWVIYELLLFLSLSSLSTDSAVITIIAAEPFAKMISGQIVQMLPHAPLRNGEKQQIIFSKLSTSAGILMFCFGIIPLLGFFYFTSGARWDLILFLPCIVMYFLYMLIMKTESGYRNESLSTLFLLNELSVYLVVTLQALL